MLNEPAIPVSNQAPLTGEILLTTSATQLPSIAGGGLVQVKSHSGSAGSAFIGGPGVTVPDGTTDTTTGWELTPGEPFPAWIPASNLNQFYAIADTADTLLLYMLLR